MCQDAPSAVLEMEAWGTTFSRADGKIAQRPFGGAGFPRTCYAADRIGHNLIHTLYEVSRYRGSGERFVLSLAVEGNRCRGLAALDPASGRSRHSPAIVASATGGHGHLLPILTPTSHRDGMALH
jgi:succinate dehydrogenase / fumarate reductase flavoprotein subunit